MRISCIRSFRSLFSHTINSQSTASARVFASSRLYTFSLYAHGFINLANGMSSKTSVATARDVKQKPLATAIRRARRLQTDRHRCRRAVAAARSPIYAY